MRFMLIDIGLLEVTDHKHVVDVIGELVSHHASCIAIKRLKKFGLAIPHISLGVLYWLKTINVGVKKEETLAYTLKMTFLRKLTF